MDNIEAVIASEDFDRVSWQGNRIHAMTLPNENLELKLDIDHILTHQKDDLQHDVYSVIVCELVFYSVDQLMMHLNYQNQTPLLITNISREVVYLKLRSKEPIWHYVIDTNQGTICFDASDLRQYVKAPRVEQSATPYLPANKRCRTPICFDLFIAGQAVSGLTMDLVPQLENPVWARQAQVSIDEDAFAFVEPAICRIYPDYADFGHWGQTVLNKQQWQAIILDLTQVWQNLLQAQSPDQYQDQRFLFEDVRIDFYRDFYRMRQLISHMLQELITWLESTLHVCSAIAIHGV